MNESIKPKTVPYRQPLIVCIITKYTRIDFKGLNS